MARRATQRMDVPREAVPFVEAMLEHLAAGRGVVLIPLDELLSTQQAADILGVSRPHLVKLLERGDIPHHRVGTHRRLRSEDVIAYQERQAARRAEADGLIPMIRALYLRSRGRRRSAS